MGGKKVKNYPSLKKLHTETGNLHRDMMFNHRFYTATNLEQIINFGLFWDTLGVKKGQKVPISLNVAHPPTPPPPPIPEAASLQDNFSWEIRTHIQ